MFKIIKFLILSAVITSAVLLRFSPPACAEGKIKISVWDFPRITLPKKPNDRFLWLREICDEFEKLNPEVSVELTKLTWNQGGEKIKIAVFAGVPPDISSSDLPLKYIHSGLIEPVDDYITPQDASDYFESAISSFKTGGKTYGFAWAQKTDYIYLNKALFAKAGAALPRDGMWSVEEFRSAMKTIASALKIRPFGFSAEREQTSELPFLFMYGGGYLDFKNAAGGVSLLHDFIYRDKISPAETGGLKTRDIWIDFKEKQALAAAPFGIWAIPALAREKKIDFDIAQYPYLNDRRSLSHSSVIGYFVFRQSDSVKRDYCIKLAKFITNAENQKVLKYYGQFPTRKSAASIYENDALMKKAFDLFEYAAPAAAHPLLPKIDEHIKSECQKILLDGGLDAAKIASKTAETGAYIAGIIASGAAANKDLKSPAAGDSPSAKTGGGILIAAIFIALAGVLLSFNKKLSGDLVKNRWAYFFMAPAVAVFLVFFIFPLARGVLISFQSYSFSGGWFDNFCGLENFTYALNDAVFIKSMFNTFLYTVIVVPANICIALVLAVLVYRLSERVQTWFKGAFYLPGVISIVTLSIVWRYIFDFKSGILNAALAAFSVQPVGWLTSEEMSLFSIIVFTILKGPGGALLIYLTALCNIPKDYFEAAAVDGAGPVRTFVKITFPLLLPQTMFLAISLTIDAMQVFAPVMLLTEGGPANSSEVVMHRVYKEAFNNLNMGAASAMSLILFVFILAASVLQYKYFKYDY
ncbi:MAG: Lactose transport system permease protein LacF [bacterium ADurb.Bin243]|nr:MAG: Lactose transport system permease protein LacF [bacterium ADurb.Bin243]